jgi:hypothetical protein
MKAFCILADRQLERVTLPAGLPLSVPPAKQHAIISTVLPSSR